MFRNVAFGFSTKHQRAVLALVQQILSHPHILESCFIHSSLRRSHRKKSLQLSMVLHDVMAVLKLPRPFTLCSAVLKDSLTTVVGSSFLWEYTRGHIDSRYNLRSLIRSLGENNTLTKFSYVKISEDDIVTARFVDPFLPFPRLYYDKFYGKLSIIQWKPIPHPQKLSRFQTCILSVQETDIKILTNCLCQ